MIAVSGGVDSVALLRATCAVQQTLEVSLVLGHFNHRFRGNAADADAAWVAALAGELGVPCEIGVAGDNPLGSATVPEEAARNDRYAFLIGRAQYRECAAILTAHTADDQVETVLHHLLRGTGIAGLQGIPPERPLANGLRLVRPLLDVSRAELEHYLIELGQDHRVDATNAQLRNTRNWLRHHTLPLLRGRFPAVDEAILRLAHQADDVRSLTAELADRLLRDALVDDGGDVVRLSVPVLSGQPRHLVRELFVRLWVQRGWSRQQMSYEKWNELAKLVTMIEGATTLPGAIEARRRGDLLVLTARSAMSRND